MLFLVLLLSFRVESASNRETSWAHSPQVKEEKEKESDDRASKAKDKLIELGRKRLDKAKMAEKAGVNSENRGKGAPYLRSDGAPMPEELRRAKSRERILEPKGKGGPKPADGLRDEKNAPYSRFARTPDGQW